MVRTPSLAHSLSTSTPCSAHSLRVQHFNSSRRVPVMASIYMQYLVSGVPAGATLSGAGWTVAETGEAATTMVRARSNSLCAMSFLLGDNAGMPVLFRPNATGHTSDGPGPHTLESQGDRALRADGEIVLA